MIDCGFRDTSVTLMLFRGRVVCARPQYGSPCLGEYAPVHGEQPKEDEGPDDEIYCDLCDHTVYRRDYEPAAIHCREMEAHNAE